MQPWRIAMCFSVGITAKKQRLQRLSVLFDPPGAAWRRKPSLQHAVISRVITLQSLRTTGAAFANPGIRKSYASVANVSLPMVWEVFQSTDPWQTIFACDYISTLIAPDQPHNAANPPV